MGVAFITTMMQATGILPTSTPYPPTSTPLPAATATPDIGNDIQVFLICQDFVRDQLISPATAEFGRITDNGYQTFYRTEQFLIDQGSSLADLGVTLPITGDGVWFSIGLVDSQNQFGAMLHGEYTCIMDYQPIAQTYRLLNLVIDER